MPNNYTLFRGKEAILKAYKFNKVPAWAIFVDRIPMFSYEGNDLNEGEDFLEEVLDNLIECMGNGTYQLRVYKEVTAKGILNTTAFNYGFKFQLLPDDEYEIKSGRATISGLQKQIDDLKNGVGEMDDDGDDNSFSSQIGRMLGRPEVQDFVLQKIFGFVNNIFGPKNSAPANMAGFTTMDTTQQQQQTPPTAAELYSALPAQEKANFDQAAYILMANDPQVGTNLMKLANLLVNKPDMYQQLTKMA